MASKIFVRFMVMFSEFCCPVTQGRDAVVDPYGAGLAPGVLKI